MSIVEKCDFVQVGGSLEHITVFTLNHTGKCKCVALPVFSPIAGTS